MSDHACIAWSCGVVFWPDHCVFDRHTALIVGKSRSICNPDAAVFRSQSLSGTLPADWGSSSTFQRLNGLYIGSNRISGSNATLFNVADPYLLKIKID